MMVSSIFPGVPDQDQSSSASPKFSIQPRFILKKFFAGLRNLAFNVTELLTGSIFLGVILSYIDELRHLPN